MHDLAIDEHLMSTHSVIDGICWVCTRRNLDLAPLTVGRHKLALRRELLELLINSLLLDTALSLNKFRV